jgi:Cu+-exporting ATPase
MNEQTVTLPITGMSCANCAANIERGLNKLNGIRDAAVNFAAEQAMVSFDAGQLNITDLVASVQQSGYSVPAAHIELPITGMSCANCAANIERALNKKVDGVVNAAVNFGTERAAVDYLADILTVEDIVAAIEKAGYGAIAPDDAQDAEDAEQQARQAEISDQTRKFIVGVVFAAPLFVLSMLRDFSIIGAWSHDPWVSTGSFCPLWEIMSTSRRRR